MKMMVDGTGPENRILPYQKSTIGNHHSSMEWDSAVDGEKGLMNADGGFFGFLMECLSISLASRG